MTEARSTDLLYGHFGEPVYDNESHKWYFTRAPQISRSLVSLEKSSVVIKPSITHSSSSKIQSALERNQNIRKLVQRFPELVPATPLLPELAQSSEIIDQVASIHDRSRSALLAFGKAKDKTHRRSKDVPIAALASGSVGSSLRLVLLKEESLRWEDDKVLGLRRLLVGDEEHGWWPGDGSPIQQVCFAETKGDSSSWLAVRYHRATSILHPRFLSVSVPKRSSLFLQNEEDRYRSSRLDPNHIATLPIESTDGSSHADVSFNPWDSTQLAIINRQGNWSIWRLERQFYPKGCWQIKPVTTGHISQGHEEDLDSTTSNEDGWGTVLWAGGGDLILVANRRMISVIQINEDRKRVVLPDLSLSKGGDWILDVKASRSDDTHFFVTTSTRTFWLHITASDDGQTFPESQSDASILLSWRHFRGQGDISLRMSVLNDEDATLVVLYSRLTSLATVFTFQKSNSPLGLPLSVSDPFLLLLSNENEDTCALIGSNRVSAEEESISTLELKSVKYDLLSESMQSSIGNQYREAGVKFYQLSVLYNNLGMRECLYVGQSIVNSMQIECPRVFKPSDIRKNPVKVLQDDFIVPNRSAPEDWGSSGVYTTSIYHDQDDVEDGPLLAKEDPWTISFEWLERKIESLSSRLTVAPTPRIQPRLPFNEFLELIRSSILNKLDENIPGIETLYEGLKTNVFFVDDVDAASIALREFVALIREMHVDDMVNDGGTLYCDPRVWSLITPQISGTLDAALDCKDLSLAHIYDSLINSWISPLSTAIPGRVRIAIEKRLREFATHLSLATVGVFLSSKIAEIDNDNEAEEIDRENMPKNEQPFSLPVRRKRSFPALPVKPQVQLVGNSSSPLASSRISEDTGFMPVSPPLAPTLPTPENTPSLRSRSSVSSLTLPSEDAASQRLRALATLTPQPALPASTSDILRHWSEGTNPDAYDWEATQNAITAGLQHPNAEDDPDVKRRRRRENRLKRQRDTILAASSQVSSTRVLESQPSPMRDTEGSSWGVRIEPTMSQSTRGEQEGRGRKKRKRGF